MNENEISDKIVDCCYKIHTKLGLLINFNEDLIKDGITRVVNKLEET